MVAATERELIRERTLDGLRAEAQGRGRPPKVDDDVLAIAQSRRGRGESVTTIARHSSIGRSTLYGALHEANTSDGGSIGHLIGLLPPDSLPLPDVSVYDQLLPSRAQRADQ